MTAGAVDLTRLEPLLAAQAFPRPGADAAHDLSHGRRVVALAKRLCAEEGARPEVVVPAAWLHDLVALPKDDSARALASRRSGAAAAEWLRSVGYPHAWLPDVVHAIEAHSFSAGIAPETVEAAIVQDADRLDALGAIGIARVFATAGRLGRPFYCENDPFCLARPADDARFTLDHFYAKLLPVAATLRTRGAQQEGRRRLAAMEAYLAQLRTEIDLDRADVAP